MFGLHVWSVVGLIVCDYYWYSTECQTVLTSGFRVSTCSRMNTDLPVVYFFLTCTSPPKVITYGWWFLHHLNLLPTVQFWTKCKFEQGLPSTSKNDYVRECFYWRDCFPSRTELCECMLTSDVGPGDVPFGSCSHMTFRMLCLLEKHNVNKWGFSISSCGPQKYSLLSRCSIFRPIYYCPKLFHFECL